jgi:hypothetical protein
MAGRGRWDNRIRMTIYSGGEGVGVGDVEGKWVVARVTWSPNGL